MIYTIVTIYRHYSDQLWEICTYMPKYVHRLQFDFCAGTSKIINIDKKDK